MGRKDILWNTRNGTYMETVKPTGYDILINGIDKYLNFNDISGSSGYGIRDNAGTMEFKNSGGAWAGVGSGTIGGTMVANEIAYGLNATTLTSSSNFTYNGSELAITGGSVAQVATFTSNITSALNNRTIRVATNNNQTSGGGTATGGLFVQTTDNGITTGGPAMATLGMQFSVSRSTTFNNSGIAGTLRAVQGTVSDQGTYSRASSQSITEEAFQGTVTHAPVITGGQAVTHTVSALNVNFAGDATVTSGSWTANVYGVRFTGGGAVAGTTTYRAFYNSAGSYDTNWTFYNDCANNNFMGYDNSKTYFGTGADASIYYDGTNLYVNPKEVGTGILNIRGALSGEDIRLGSAGFSIYSTQFPDDVGSTSVFFMTYDGVGNTIQSDTAYLIFDILSGGYYQFSTGKVGIGTTTDPNNTLDLQSSTECALSITSTGTNTDPLIKFELTNNSPLFTMGIDDSDSDVFKISGSALGTNDKVIINSSNNVGIGTTSTISARLHLISTTEQLRVGYDASNYLSTTINSTGSVTLDLVGTTPSFTFSDPVNINGLLTLSAQNIATDTTTGMKVATATSQKLGFWNATPIVQPTTAIAEATFTENAGGLVVNVDSTFDGYTVQQVIKALRDAGLLA
jgi:hypothetical protein